MPNGNFHHIRDTTQVTLPGPTKVGTYELRYWNGDNKKVMATRAIQITPIEMGIEGPEAVEVNTTFGVTWKGPGARYDEAQIVKAGSDKVVVRKRLRNDPGYDENKASIKAPREPGEYVLRYYNGDNKAVLAEQPLSVQ